MLSYRDKQIKIIILQLMNFDDPIRVHARAEQEVVSLIAYLRYECTILFHLGAVDYIFYPNRNEAVLHPQYLYSKKEYDSLVYQLTGVVKKIRNQVCIVDSQYQRELRIHDALCCKVSYLDEGIQSHSIIGPLLFHRGVCDGFAKAAKVLLQECGISSHVVSGTAVSSANRYEPHAWNIVCINGKWYHFDVTFDNTLSQTDIRYDYFNLSTDEIKRDHNIENTTAFSSMACINKDDYYVVSGLYFESLETIMYYLNKCFRQRNTHVQLRAERTIDKEKIVKLFAQELRALNLRATYEECFNIVRNVYSWRIKYN